MDINFNDGIVTDTDEAIRRKLRLQLEQSGMASAVRKLVVQICDTKDDLNNINPDDVVNEIYRRGLLKTFMENMDTEIVKDDLGLRDTVTNSDSDGNSGSEVFTDEERLASNLQLVEKTLRKSGKYYLKMEIQGGRAFLEHLLDETEDSSLSPDFKNVMSKKEFRGSLVLHVFYKSQHFISKPVICRCDPDFKEVFLIEIGHFLGKDGSVATKMLNINEPLRIMVVREDINLHMLGGSLVAYCTHDWRSLLITENGLKKRLPLQLMGIGPEHSICVGILQVRLSLIPNLSERISESTYLDRVNDDEASHENRERSFIPLAKRWWKDFVEIRADHQFRLIRIFAYDEKMVARPVMAFVKPVVVDDLLLTPFHAAWFVSLLPTNEINHPDKCNSSKSGGTNPLINKILPGIQNGIGGCLLSERWQNIESIVASKSGTVEDHTVLLTSLLHSFGLNAYVALGTKKGKGSWAWTVTFGEKKQEPTFWESTTGDYYDHYSYPTGIGSYDQLPDEILGRLVENRHHTFLTISCVFNGNGLYANVQPTTSVDFVDWDLNNQSKWKYLPHKDVESCEPLHPVHLRKSTLNWDFIAKKLEYQLKNLITFARKNKGQSTKWDNQLPSFIGQRLYKEELEVSTSGQGFKDYFKLVVQNLLPTGYDFLAHTFHSQCIEAHILFSNIEREPLGEKIVFIRGDNVTLSIKVKIFPYPEDVPSVRFMVACKYIPVN